MSSFKDKETTGNKRKNVFATNELQSKQEELPENKLSYFIFRKQIIGVSLIPTSLLQCYTNNSKIEELKMR